MKPQLIMAAGYNGYFIKSVDGGKTWMHTKVADEKVRDLYFSSHSNGWIVGNRGTLLYTIDGGVTWAKKNINEDLHRLKPGKKFLYVVGKNAIVLRIRK